MKLYYRLAYLLFCFASFASTQGVSGQGLAFDGYSSNEGRGLFFSPERLLPKSASLTLVSRQVIPAELYFPEFYQDPKTKELYLYTHTRLVKVSALDEVGQPKTKRAELQEVYTMEKGVAVPGDDFVFVQREPQYDGLAVRLPQHHTLPSRLFAINRNKTFPFDKVHQRLNELNLTLAKRVSTRSGGFNIIYDRLFINDEDPNKFLVIYSTNDRIYANFLSNDGEWEFPEPKIIHTDVVVFNEQGQMLARRFDGSTDKSTLLLELSSIKSANGYYIGYSIASWESSQGFGPNLGTCHVSLLSDKLEVVRTVQLPEHVSTRDQFTMFGSSQQLQLVRHSDTLSAFIQMPGTWDSKIFAATFDKDLRQLSPLRYLANKSTSNNDLAPLVPFGSGNLITYRTERKTYSALFTQFISNSGLPYMPVEVFSIPEHLYVYRIHVAKTKDDVIHYYLSALDKKENKNYLYHYKIASADFVKAASFEISSTNWEKDPDVKHSLALAETIEKSVAMNSLARFQKKLRDRTKTAYVDSAFVVRKYVMLREQEGHSFEAVAYYDERGTARMLRITLKAPPNANTRIKPGTFTIFFNADGNKFWELKENADGSRIYGEKEVQSRRLLEDFKFTDPYHEFHQKN